MPRYGKVYQDYFGLSHTDYWCAAFVSWCIYQSGVEESYKNAPRSKYSPVTCSSLINYFIDNNKFVRVNDGSNISSNYKKETISYDSSYIPQKGDLIFFVKGRKKGLTDHIGIVRETSNGSTVKTVEGNVNRDQYTNGVVGLKEYNLDNSTILGYAINLS